jgi:hypothetical protein
LISLFGLIDSNGLIGLNGLIACMLLKPVMIFYWPHAGNGDTWFVFLLSRFGSKCFPTLILRWSLHGYFVLLLLYLKRWSFLVLLCYLSFFGSGASDARSTSLGGVSELHYS